MEGIGGDDGLEIVVLALLLGAVGSGWSGWDLGVLRLERGTVTYLARCLLIIVAVDCDLNSLLCRVWG